MAHSTRCTHQARSMHKPTMKEYVAGDGENWLAPGGGHGCRLKEGGGGLGNGHL